MKYKLEKEMLRTRNYEDCKKFAQNLVNMRNDGEQMDIREIEIYNLARPRHIVYQNKNYVLLWSDAGKIGNGVIMSQKAYFLWRMVRRHGRLLCIAPSPEWREQLCERLRKELGNIT